MASSIGVIFVALSCGSAIGARSWMDAASMDNHTEFSCDSHCRKQHKGRGEIIGTSPACDGDCSQCSGSCQIVTVQTGMSDYGAGCWSGDKVCCCQMAVPPIQRVKGQDGISVMTFNTYLLEVNVVFQVNAKPNLQSRARSIADWFATLKVEAIPDVVVLNEIFSFAAEDLLKTLCSEIWQKNWRSGLAKFIPCKSQSHFAHATMAVNPTGATNVQKCGGVVVLVKKGSRITEANDQLFTHSIGDDSMANKGFWAVRMEKGTQQYWIIGTHAQAYIEGRGLESVNIRLRQFAQMRQYVDANVGSKERVVYAGDMNTFSHAIQSENTQPEIEGMLQTLGASGAPAIAGTLMPNGFWLPLDTPLYMSADVERNHYIHNIPADRVLGSHQYDWILVPGPGDRLATPKSARYQYVPVKSDTCYVSEVIEEPVLTDDTSDHYAVVAEFCYGTDCTPITPVVGHRGYGPQLPGKPFCSTSAGSLEPLKATTCHELCYRMSKGGGRIVGTAPFCEGSCSGDCPGGFCQVVTTKSGLSDYGNGCLSGDKVCCCDKK